MDHNIPADCASHPLAPWNQPDDVELPTVTICWCCDKPEQQCDCEDGFDPRTTYCDSCAGDCGDCTYETP